jgi:hypothetical protein
VTWYLPKSHRLPISMRQRYRSDEAHSARRRLPIPAFCLYNQAMNIPRLSLPEQRTCAVTNLNTINVIVGKNGCGKSSILKAIENVPMEDIESWGVRRYITPERGGTATTCDYGADTGNCIIVTSGGPWTANWYALPSSFGSGGMWQSYCGTGTYPSAWC